MKAYVFNHSCTILTRKKKEQKTFFYPALTPEEVKPEADPSQSVK